MNEAYEWLYKQHIQEFEPTFQKAEEQLVSQMTEEASLNSDMQIFLADSLADLCFLCGSESFALGLRFGLALAGEFWSSEY